MTKEELENRAKEFVGKIASGTPEEMEYYANILVEFANETTKELEKEKATGNLQTFSKRRQSREESQRGGRKMSELIFRPIERIKKKCLCCGNEMELFPYEIKDFCNRCYIIVCREVFNKANSDMTVKEIKERIRKNIEVEK